MTAGRAGGRGRFVGLSGLALDAVNRQRRSVAVERLTAGKVWRDQDLVFPSLIGAAQDSRNLRKAFRTRAQAAGYRHSFHQLRHFSPRWPPRR